MWSVNMQHFLDEKGSTDQAPTSAKELADHFGAIVATVTLDFTGRTIEVSGVTWPLTDAVLITASSRSNEPVGQAAKMCRKRGRIVLVGGCVAEKWDGKAVGRIVEWLIANEKMDPGSSPG